MIRNKIQFSFKSRESVPYSSGLNKSNLQSQKRVESIQKRNQKRGRSMEISKGIPTISGPLGDKAKQLKRQQARQQQERARRSTANDHVIDFHRRV